jgi:hypothetical protein
MWGRGAITVRLLLTPDHSNIHKSSSVIISHPMPPKKTPVATENPITMTEELLLRAAARITAAIQFKDAHPNGDFSEWSDHLRGELVCRTQSLQSFSYDDHSYVRIK